MSTRSRASSESDLGVVHAELLDSARERKPSAPVRRDSAVSWALGGGFLAAAILAAALLPWQRPADPLVVGALILVYAFVSKIEFEIGTGSAVPTQLVLVPMLFVLPAALVPLCVAAGFLIAAVVDHARGRMDLRRAPTLLTSSWHSLGPAVVLAVFARPELTWRDAPVYACALLAQFALDFGSSAARERLAFGISFRTLMPFFVWIYLVDSLLAPVGLLAAFAAADRPSVLLLLLPLVALLALLADDRRERIDLTLALSRAYKAENEAARRDALTGLANRLAWDEGVAAAQQAGVPTSVVLLDVDRLKLANDTRGHDFGDALLQAIGAVIDETIGDAGLVARLGGDEFAVLLPESNDEACSVHVVRILTAMSAHPGVDGFPLSVAAGHASCPPFATVAEAQRMADGQMYRGKRGRVTPLAHVG